MSQAAELLDSLVMPMSAIEDPSLDPHFVINDDRTITVPEGFRKLAVQFDHNMETITFDCPRYWDGIDLSTMNGHVVVRTPGSDGGIEMIPISNIQVDDTDDSIFHFDWTVTIDITRFPGDLEFLIHLREIDPELSYPDYHWSTEINRECYVAEGMDCSDVNAEIQPMYKDLNGVLF